MRLYITVVMLFADESEPAITFENVHALGALFRIRKIAKTYHKDTKLTTLGPFRWKPEYPETETTCLRDQMRLSRVLLFAP